MTVMSRYWTPGERILLALQSTLLIVVRDLPPIELCQQGEYPRRIRRQLL